MSTRTARRIALASVAVVAVLGSVVVLTSGGILVEQWYILRLDSDSESIRLHAADELAQLKSARAVPRLLELIAEDNRENADAGGGHPFWSGPPGSEPTRWPEEWIAFTPLAYSIYEIGPPALPTIRKSNQELAVRGRLGLILILLESTLECVRTGDSLVVKRMAYGGTIEDSGDEP